MRFKIGDSNMYLSSEVEFRVSPEISALAMDTIVPSAPAKRVEEAVSVQSPVNQNNEEHDVPVKKVETADVPQNGEAKVVEENTSAAESHEINATSIRDTTAQRSRSRVEAPREVATEQREEEIDIVPTQQRSVVVEEQSVIVPVIGIDHSMLNDTIVEMDSVNILSPVDVSTTSLSYASNKEGVALPIKLERSDGIFTLLLACFLLLAYIYNGGITYFKDNVMLVFSASKSEKLESQSTTKEIFSTFFLLFLSALLISISLYEALDRLIPMGEEDKRPFVTITLFVVSLLLFAVLKLVFNKLIGFIFDVGARIAVWNQSYIVLLSMLGLLCFFPTLLLIYSNVGASIIIGLVLVLFLIVQIILVVRVIIYFVSQKYSFLYLIAYLCAVEILPYIFLALGLVYLYKIDVFNTIL